MNGSVLVTSVVVQNYQSIRHCDVRLGPLTFLAGLNGAGKSSTTSAADFPCAAFHATVSHE